VLPRWASRAAALALLASCRHPVPVQTAALAGPAFAHALAPHAALACTSCHGGDKMPPHAACARCHGQAYTPAATPTSAVERPACAICHERPPLRVLAARFSHKLHLDRGRMEARAGFHDQCEDCHAPGADGGQHRALAGHDTCARCHEPKLALRPQMSDCTACHAAGAAPIELGRELIRGDLVFSHAAHQVDRVGRTYGCRYCHEDTEDWRSARDRKPPEMQRCTLCHEDRRVTPPEVRIGNCQSCHQTAAASFRGVLAPRSHQLGTVAPDDHDLAFRRHHATAARESGTQCARCHQGLSGSRRDSCAECHAIMRPRDHTLTWREQDHGQEAAALRERCVQCHAADYCEACHSVAPRSHVPLVQWGQEHGLAARLNLRSCFACHTFESTCIGCHQRGLR
jgi:Cytochrome c7 and related cytochrome c